MRMSKHGKLFIAGGAPGKELMKITGNTRAVTGGGPLHGLSLKKARKQGATKQQLESLTNVLKQQHLNLTRVLAYKQKHSSM